MREELFEEAGEPRPRLSRGSPRSLAELGAEMAAMTTTSAPDSALVVAVRAALAGAGDPVRAAGQQAYMKSAMPYRGLTSPELRGPAAAAAGRPGAGAGVAGGVGGRRAGPVGRRRRTARSATPRWP